MSDGWCFFAQGVFYNGFFLLYLVSSRTAHRVVGYFEEEAIISYTEYLTEIYHKSPSTTGVSGLTRASKDIVIAVRADEAGHRDVNHRFADELSQT